MPDLIVWTLIREDGWEGGGMGASRAPGRPRKEIKEQTKNESGSKEGEDDQCYIPPYLSGRVWALR